MASSQKSLLRDALSATTVKDKGPPVIDGILSITPDTPEVVEWRRSALDITETSSTYLDDEDEAGPNELFGKFTWKIENFSEISKRELRSNVFDVGNYKWYILVYPQGCDVCNHLSLFLCVADYDKLLPGWSHFAQFTIAVVNKDPKKSKYSDTLHRFCKKEHDWGWKKFMELSKVLDGFTVADTLVIKAQVQVILDKPQRPFRCLDPQYRRELVRVYLTNVEGVCRRFCDDKRARLMWVKDEAESFKSFWLGLNAEQQRKLLLDKADAILKALVKQFFNEKEVTSTLVMDALYSGCKQIEEASRMQLEGRSTDADSRPLVLIRTERNSFSLQGDLLDLADRVSKDFIPMAKDEKAVQPNDGLALRSGQEDDYRRDSIERDEKRLAELGRKTVEMLAISHIITEKMETSYRDAEALKRQDQLIAEEFEMLKQEEEKHKAQAEKDRERKQKKKERQKAKKEEDKAKREAEEAERQKQLEEERRVAEVAAAAKRRQEEEAAKAAAQAQAQAQAKAKAAAAQARAAAAAAQQKAAPAKQPVPHATHAAKGPSSQQQQQQKQEQDQAQRAAMPESGPTAPSRGAPAAQHTAPAHAAQSPQEAVGGMTSSTVSSVASDTSESADSKGVGTLDQAMRLAEEDSDADGSLGSSARAHELADELSTLRMRVRSLEAQLADRDAELYAVRAQLAELGPLATASGTKSPAAAAAPSAHVSSAFGGFAVGVREAGDGAEAAGGAGGAADDPTTRAAAVVGNGPSVLPPAGASKGLPAVALAGAAHAGSRRPMGTFEARGVAATNGPHAQPKPPPEALPQPQPQPVMLHAQFNGGARTASGAAAGAESKKPVPLPDVPAGAPSYRNAAAGVVMGAPAHVVGVPGRGSGGPTPAPAASPAPAKVAAMPIKDEPTTPGAPVAAQHVASHLNHAAAEFNASAHLMMRPQVVPQPAQARMQFAQLATKRAQASPQMDSPGLDDFAHMGLIDDLLTE